MKLRNKKTGEIRVVHINWFDGRPDRYFDSLSEAKEELSNWEDVKEPLIEDEKIRKAVRAWAEVNELEPDYEVRYSSNSFSLISWQANIEFNTAIEGLKGEEKYTITELCGEEEDEA